MINLYSSNANLMNRNKVVEMNVLCKGECGQEAKFGHWCRVLPIHCPVLRIKFEDKRREHISKTKKLLSRRGLNPMQNPEICKKNHSPERNEKASKTLKNLGKLILLPQQIESTKLREKRRINVSKSLQKLSKEGKLWFQRAENFEKLENRNKKISEKLKELFRSGKLSTPHLTPQQRAKSIRKLIEWWTPERRKEHAIKSSIIMKEKVKLGLVRPPKARKFIAEKNGKKIIFRSSWEKEVAEFLDKNNINWEFEPFMVEFEDSQTKENHFTLPDFFIPKLGTIIEVKSDKEFNSQKTIDKIKGIKEFGFNFILIGRKQINQIRKDQTEDLLSQIQGDKNS